MISREAWNKFSAEISAELSAERMEAIESIEREKWIRFAKDAQLVFHNIVMTQRVRHGHRVSNKVLQLRISEWRNNMHRLRSVFGNYNNLR